MENEKFELVEEIKGKVKSKNRENYTYYLRMRCKDCGHEITITKSDIVRRTRTCAKCEEKKYREDFVGFENDNFKVVDFDRAAKNKLYYKVLCKKCNNTYVMRKDNIFTHKSCMKCSGNGVTASIDTVFRRHWDTYVRGAIDRGYSFDLTTEEFKELTVQDCYYCGAEPTMVKSMRRYNKTGQPFKFNGIDRLNSSLGYYKDNCVPCCSTCNRMKMAMNEQEFKDQIDKIYNHSIKCSTTSETPENQARSSVGSSESKREEP